MRMVTYFDCVRLDGNICMDCDVFGRCVGVCDDKVFMGEQMMIKADKARDMTIHKATRQFYKKIKSACKKGQFGITIFYTSKYEISLYTYLAKANGYDCIVDCTIGCINISWQMNV